MREYPSNKWACELCYQLGPEGKETACFLCPLKGGAMLETKLSLNSPWLQLFFDKYVEES